MSQKIAVIGAGYWGKNLIRNFHQLGVLGCICDENELLRENYRSSYPDVPFSLAYTDVLEDNSIDGVALASPAASHFAIGMQVLEAGKHLFVEKPLALRVAEGEQMVKKAREKSRVLMVGHILQYHSAVLKLKELIDRGELGKVQHISSNRLSIGKIRSEENILWSFAPHDISVILMLLNEEPYDVYATGAAYLQTGVADVTLTVMAFPSGANAHLFVSWLHPFKEQKLVVVGDKKMAVFDDVGKDKLMLYRHQVEWVQRHPIARKGEAEIVEVPAVEPLRAECEEFLEAIRKPRKPRTDGEEGLKVLRILDACQRSLDGEKDSGAMKGPKVIKGPGRTERIPAEVAADYFTHESTYIDNNVEIGTGTKVWHFSHVLSNSKIGRNCNIGQNVVIGPNAVIGDGCKLQNNVSVYKGVTLEEEVFCGPSMVFTNVYNPRGHIRRMEEIRPTLVKRRATLGANCTIVCGHMIGEYAFVAAGAVVTTNVPDYALMMGNPAKRKGWMCACGIRLSFDGKGAVCKACGMRYAKIGEDSIKEIGKE